MQTHKIFLVRSGELLNPHKQLKSETCTNVCFSDVFSSNARALKEKNIALSIHVCSIRFIFWYCMFLEAVGQNEENIGLSHHRHATHAICSFSSNACFQKLYIAFVTSCVQHQMCFLELHVF